MKDITTISIDIAKNYIQIHGANSKQIKCYANSGMTVFSVRKFRDDSL